MAPVVVSPAATGRLSSSWSWSIPGGHRPPRTCRQGAARSGTCRCQSGSHRTVVVVVVVVDPRRAQAAEDMQARGRAQWHLSLSVRRSQDGGRDRSRLREAQAARVRGKRWGSDHDHDNDHDNDRDNDRSAGIGGCGWALRKGRSGNRPTPTFGMFSGSEPKPTPPADGRSGVAAEGDSGELQDGHNGIGHRAQIRVGGDLNP
jgi:hypothetical protein